MEVVHPIGDLGGPVEHDGKAEVLLLLQDLVQGPTRGKFHDKEVLALLEADSLELDDVWVGAQGAEEVRLLFQDVHLALVGIVVELNVELLDRAHVILVRPEEHRAEGTWETKEQERKWRWPEKAQHNKSRSQIP